MNDAEIVTQALDSYHEIALGDVQHAMNGKAMLGAVILAACCIDYFARINAAARGASEDVGPRFESFVETYLSMYDPKKLYTDLRCDLVHAYTGSKDFVYTDGHPESHLQHDTQRNKVIINAESFVADVFAAYEEFRKALFADPVRLSAAARFISSEGYLTVGLINPSNLKTTYTGTVNRQDGG
jgi:hypothetical protein